MKIGPSTAIAGMRNRRGPSGRASGRGATSEISVPFCSIVMTSSRASRTRSCHPLGPYGSTPRIVKGIATLPLGVLGAARAVQSLRHITYGAGMLLGWSGLRYREYLRVHGR